MTKQEDSYDLVVVGAGLSGLAAAYFFRKAHPEARVLLLDNHDDFGGHAKRNEFDVAGKKVLGYGGSQTMESPGGYPDEVKALLRDIGIRQDTFYDAFDQEFYRRHDLAGGVYFNSRDWGESRLVRWDIGGLGDYMPLAATDLSAVDAVNGTPLSEKGKAQLLRVLTETSDCMPDIPFDEKRGYLYTITYRVFLERHLGVTEEEVFRVLQDLASDTGVGIESAPAGA
ncbi:MAG: FAD/NAD(P)-binding protein, partial [Verrucomicrobiota bacterium]